eukprot:7615949-Alexandrium_andersonii.AAC.1
MGGPDFRDSEPWTGPFGPLGVLGPPPPQAELWTPSSLRPKGYMAAEVRRHMKCPGAHMLAQHRWA